MQSELKSYGDLTLVGADKLHTTASETHAPKWLIENIWAFAGTGILAGMPKTGKTWLALDMAESIASGTPFLGQFPAQQGTVLIYSPEGSPLELKNRMEQIKRRREDSGALQRVPTTERIYFMRKNRLCLSLEKDQEAIELAVMDVQPKLLIFDPLAECFHGDENSSGEVKPMTSFINRLAREYGCSVLLTHHITKNSGGDPGTWMRGSSALFAFGDSYLFLERDRSGIILSSRQRQANPCRPCGWH